MVGKDHITLFANRPAGLGRNDNDREQRKNEGDHVAVPYFRAPNSLAHRFPGDIANDVRHRYIELRKKWTQRRANLLADELVPHALPLLSQGSNHFYRDPEIDLKSLALANIVADELGEAGGSDW